MANVVCVMAQCNMLIKYSLDEKLTDVRARLSLVSPDGMSCVLLNDTARRVEKNYRLEQLGEYRLAASFNSDRYGCDSLERQFKLTGKELDVVADLNFSRDTKNHSDRKCHDSVNSCTFRIERRYKASPQVKINYLPNMKGENGAPCFCIKNESRDTLYGEWLPGYFWGTLSYNVNGKYVGNYMGQICTSWAPAPPLYPDSVKSAWVSSFRTLQLKSGKFRFNVWYSTTEKMRNSVPLACEREKFRWWSKVQDWYLLQCDFEVK
ncbi:hypothetical protein [Bacteroides sp. Ga6A1]|nr:hypothetical protein [Bacteroides sp. Ga6A1]